MQNPFLEKRSYSLAYGLAWILIIGLHVSVLYFFSDQSLVNSIADALVFNLLYAVLGLSVWFAVRYYDSTRGSILDTFLYHLGTAALSLALWIGTSYLIMKYLFPGLSDYHDFLDSSMPWRGISGLFFYSIMVMIYHLYITQEDRKITSK